MRGFLNLNKPPGQTSRDVVNTITRLLRTKKVGHAGTLDPMATGVLVVAVEQATRLVSCVQNLSKEYRAEFLLGRRSNTDDVTGQVVEVPVTSPPTREQIEQHLPRFLGKIQQVPPAYSAVHVGGERAYDKARRAESFELTAREVEIYALEILNYVYPRLSLRMECGSGTYVRSVGRDLGDLLGCGAAMSGLVRTRIGEYRLEQPLDVNDLTPEAARGGLLPLASAVPHLPRHHCSPEDEVEIRHGRGVRTTLPPTDTDVAMLTPAGELLALARHDASRGQLRPHLVLP